MAGKWQSMQFGQLLAEPVRNGIYKQKEFHGHGTKIVNMGELFAHPRLRAVLMKRVELSVSEKERFTLARGDLIFARRSLVAEGAGKCSVVLDIDEPTTFESSIIRARPDGSKSNPLFLYYFFNSTAGFHSLDTIRRQVSVAGITGSDLARLEIPLPPLPEQCAIAHVLGILDDKIELNRRMNETLEAMARALFNAWFVDFAPVHAKAEGRDPGLPKPIADLFPDSFADSELGEIPVGWHVRKLSTLCTLGRGASPRPINDYMDGEVPWIKIADATAADGPFLFETKEKVKIAGAEKSVAVYPGDLILSNSATCGVPIFVELRGCIHDGWLYFKDLQTISKLYLFHSLVELTKHLVQIADGSVQKNLNTSLVGQQAILVPPQELVEAFEKQASAWFVKMRLNGLETRTLATLRDTLLPKLISGDLRVKHAETFLGRVV